MKGSSVVNFGGCMGALTSMNDFNLEQNKINFSVLNLINGKR